MARRSDHTREELKELAIAAGQDLIEKDGFINFSARKVARKIGYTIGTIYNVFENHNHLVLNINAVTLDELYVYTAEGVKKGGQGVNAVKMLAGAYIEFARQNYNRWSALFEFNLPQKATLPNWYADKINKLFKLVEVPLLPLLDNNAKNAERAAKVLWSGIHGICQLGLTGKLDTVGAESIEILTINLIENYMRGIS